MYLIVLYRIVSYRIVLYFIICIVLYCLEIKNLIIHTYYRSLDVSLDEHRDSREAKQMFPS